MKIEISVDENKNKPHSIYCSKYDTNERIYVLVDNTKEYDKQIFSGTMIAGNETKYQIIGAYRNDWCWNSFKPFYGTISLME